MATRKNLCPNPACGNDVTGWGGTAAPTRSTGLTGLPRTTGAHYGINGFAQIPTGAASAGLTYTASLYFQNNTGSSLGSKVVYLAFTRSSGGDDFSQTKSVTLPTGVTRIDFTGVAPALATGVYLLVDSFNASVGSGVEITACLIEQVGVLDTYFDGDTAGASWDGTPENSTSTLPDVVAGASPNGIAVPVALGSPAVGFPSAAPGGIGVPVRLGTPIAGDLPAPSVTDGGWYGLLSVLKERSDTKRRRESVPPAACPHDGEPLLADGHGGLMCRFDGWRWPQNGGAIR